MLALGPDTETATVKVELARTGVVRVTGMEKTGSGEREMKGRGWLREGEVTGCGLGDDTLPDNNQLHNVHRHNGTWQNGPTWLVTVGRDEGLVRRG